MSSTRLSICIATLNRCDCLAETIHKFAEQMLSGVELVVVDGGSVDLTQSMVLQAVQLYPWISYYRLSSNGGIDADYDKSVHLAKGKYCWMFSDDDWPLPGALQTVFDACSEGHDFIFVDAEVRDVKMKTILLANRSRKLSHDLVLEGHDMDALFKLTGSALSFIGSCVVSRDVWINRDCKSYYGYYFPHVAVLFQQAFLSTSLVLHKPLIAIRFGNATWSSKAFKIWMILWPELIWQMASISSEAKASVVPRQPWLNLKTLIWQRAKGTYSYQQYKIFLEPLPLSLLTKIQLILVSSIPPLITVPLAWLAIRYAGDSQRYLAEEFRMSPYCQKGIGKWMADRLY
jgi:abequosyltransferase